MRVAGGDTLRRYDVHEALLSVGGDRYSDFGTRHDCAGVVMHDLAHWLDMGNPWAWMPHGDELYRAIDLWLRGLEWEPRYHAEVRAIATHSEAWRTIGFREPSLSRWTSSLARAFDRRHWEAQLDVALARRTPRVQRNAANLARWVRTNAHRDGLS